MFCPFEATEAWTDGSKCPQLTAVQQLLETIRILEEYGDVCILQFTRSHRHRRVHY